MTYEELLSRLKYNSHFSFTRWGDGEFTCMKAAYEETNRKFNTDKHEYFLELGINLALLLEDYQGEKDYIHGLQGMSKRELPDLVQRFYYPYVKEPYTDSDILHKASIKGYLDELFETLRKKDKIVLVGPDRMSGMRKYFDFNHVVIPDVNCWTEFTKVYRMLRLVPPNTIILYCASMMSNVLIDEMWNQLDTWITQIDCGSVFEPYIGYSNRKYHQMIVDRKNL